MSTADVLIIGGGPAGLAAAITLVRQLHKVIVFDSGSYRNGISSHMHNVPSWNHKDPEDFRAAARKELSEDYKTCAVEKTNICSLTKIQDGLEAKDSNGKSWKGKKVILATGSVDDFPPLPGYQECWGKGIFHCLFCHGYEERDSASSGILAIEPCNAAMPAMHLARNASQLTKAVVIYTNGADKLSEELQAALGDKSAIKVDNRPIKSVAKGIERSNVVVEFEDGGCRTESFLAHSPRTYVRGPFVEQLRLELAPPLNDIKVTTLFNQTSVHGVFAAGDCMTMAKIVPNALANGSMAAAGASMQLQAEAHGHKSGLG